MPFKRPQDMAAERFMQAGVPLQVHLVPKKKACKEQAWPTLAGLPQVLGARSSTRQSCPKGPTMTTEARTC